jgi:hypothetical protein
MADQPNNPNQPQKIVANKGWSKGTPRQRPAPPPTPPATPSVTSAPPGILAQAKSLVDAYMSRGITQDKRCDEDTKKTRLASCHGVESAGIPPCQYRKDSTAEEGRYYCGECGCGDRKATWLNAKSPEDYTKLDFPKVVCPLNMPGFTNYTPADQETVERSMKYDFTRKRQIEKLVTITVKATDANTTQTQND